MKGLARLLILFLMSFGILVWFGCAGSKPKPTPATNQEAVEPENSGQEDEIEKLLGLDESGGNQAQSGNENQQGQEQEDDLLKMLTEGENANPPAAEATPNEKTSPPAETQRKIQQLESKVRNLQTQVEQQKQTIAQLRSQLLAKEEEIRRLKEQRSSSGAFTSASTFSGDYEAEYKRALDLFHNRQYREAIQVFQQLVNQNPNHPLADNAQYWIGESYFALGQYKKAILAFEKVFLFDQSNKNDYAQYKLGLCYYQLGDKQRARSEFQKLIDQYPRSPLVNKARQYLQKIS